MNARTFWVTTLANAEWLR